MPTTVVSKRRHPKMDPIGYDELMSNAGMSGFVSFLLPAPESSPLQGVDRAIEPPRPAQLRPAE